VLSIAVSLVGSNPKPRDKKPDARCTSTLARKLNLRRIQAIQRLAAKAMIDKDPISIPPSDREILAPIRRVCRMTKQTKMLLAYIASRREVDQADLEKPRINKPR
jgi:hypothetical protein